MKAPAEMRPRADGARSPGSCTHTPSRPRACGASGRRAAGWGSGWTGHWSPPGSTEEEEEEDEDAAGAREPQQPTPTCLLTTKQTLPPLSVIADLSFFFSL